MRRIALCSLLWLLICAVVVSCATKKKETKPDWPECAGAFFSIKYPPGFSVRRSMDGRDPENAWESAYFTSPDKSVEFYVFAPRWDGDPKDIALDPKREVKASQKTVRDKYGSTRWTTIRARDGSYTRSIVAKLNKHGGTWLAFQIRYRDARAYAKYEADYKRFKSSVVVIGE